MLLKSLEIQGFKSFPDKTKLNFNKGITAVVGPNGSGKSNISDAVRWVLGEQSTKTLRGAKMEDVIFLGTQSRKSQGFAQVSITVDNTSRYLNVESDEVTITRKYYRSGDSEYMINGANVRLKDINELFMDTGLGKDGYSMIGQGKIAEIVGAKSNERREIFEEASGISKFRYRKNESERRLNMAEENLLRLKDILVELEDRIGPLKSQSEKAKQFLVFAEKKKVLEVSVWVETLEKSKQVLRQQEDRLTLCQSNYEEIEQQIEELEQKTAEVFSDMQSCLTKIDELRKQREQAELDIAKKNSDIAVLKNDIEHNNENTNRIENEMHTYRLSGGEMESEVESKQEQADKKRTLVEQLDIQIAALQQELLHLTEQNDAFHSKAASLNESLNRLILEQTELKMKVLSSHQSVEEQQQRLILLSQSSEQRARDIEDLSNQLQTVEEGLSDIYEQQQQLHNSIKGYELKIDSRKKRLEQMQSEYHSIDLMIKEKLQNAKLLNDLEQNMEGFAYSVKSILKNAKNNQIKGILGAVSQIISVDQSYSVAIETALGGSLQHVVVENENTAKYAISMLKEQKAGRATFLPLTSVKGNRLAENGLETIDGFVSLACDLISADEKYQGIIHSLLGRIAVVDNLDTAVIMAKKYGYRFRIVTLDGQVVNAGGSFTGGSQNKSQGILSRKNEIEKLQVQAQELSEKKAQLEVKLKEASQEVAELDAQIVAINSELTVLQEDKIRFEGERKHVGHVLAETKSQLENMDLENAAATKRMQEHQRTIEATDALMKQNDQSMNKIQSELSELEGSKGDMSARREELSNHLSAMKMEKLENQKDIDALMLSIEEIKNRSKNAQNIMDSLQNQKDVLSQKNSKITQSIEQLSQQIEEIKKQTEEIEQEIEQTAKQREQLEASTSEIRAEQKQKNSEKENISRELVKFEERKISVQKECDNIILKLWEEYQLTRSEAGQFAVPVSNLIETQRDLNEVKSNIKALGTVNLGAIEEYAEVSERYEFLSVQIKDVEKSRDELTSLIQDLTKKMEEIFAENFHKINNNFGKIFVELFGGGKAELRLTDGENVLDCGIDIYVQPPGKIIKNLAALSGGEQAFVAIAIYFAILKVRPAPFCILDEIEAALDDVNVVKYASYLRSMSDNTQFILITHRRGSMEEADVLYGVTMQEEGVSKLLELKVSEIEQRLGMKQE
ncbi:MAG: smc [Oscillospiraceae bacterium]|nr:smc [Oscillospiraceae bacterium]